MGVRCEYCGAETLDRSEAELREEFEEKVKPYAGDFPEDPEDRVILCTTCYEEALAWTATKTPEEIAEMKREYYETKGKI